MKKMERQAEISGSIAYSNISDNVPVSRGGKLNRQKWKHFTPGGGKLRYRFETICSMRSDRKSVV